jgi:sugar/nucleoside kinase (ribokinase family)
VPLAAGDTVVFVIWREHFIADVQLAKSVGCTVVVGLDAVNSEELSGIDLAIGSHNDVIQDFDPMQALDRFSRIVITEGAAGATEYSPGTQIHLPAKPVEVVDATGAGDAFLAGYLTAMTLNKESAEERLELGIAWAAKTIQLESSVPPAFETL